MMPSMPQIAPLAVTQWTIQPLAIGCRSTAAAESPTLDMDNTPLDRSGVRTTPSAGADMLTGFRKGQADSVRCDA